MTAMSSFIGVMPFSHSVVGRNISIQTRFSTPCTLNPFSRKTRNRRYCSPLQPRCLKSSKTVSAIDQRSSSSPTDANGTGTLLICALNMAVFALDHLVRLPFVPRFLYMHHAAPRLWQPVTALFCHASFSHLRGNLFLLLTFGRYIEDVWGPTALIASYLLCGACANIVSLVLVGFGKATAVVSLGASGAVFSLFTLSILCRLQLRIGRLIECAILCSYVGAQIRDEVRQAIMAARASSGVGAGISVLKVDHVAHLTGALLGVLLMLFIRAARRVSASSANNETI
jgi:membrane associated rhomboid family serine protease